MRYLMLLSLWLVTTISFAQSVEELDELKAKIDNTPFTETVIADDTAYDFLHFNERVVIGYFHQDTLLKTIARYYNSSRMQVAYYSHNRNATSYDVFYVKEYDSSTNNLLAEVYAIKDVTMPWRTAIIKSTILQPRDEDERNNSELLISRADHSYAVASRRLDDQGYKTDLLVMVIGRPGPLSGDCGDLARAAALKFQVLESPDGKYSNKDIYLIKPCFWRDDFPIFKIGTVMRVKAASRSGAVNFNFMVSYPPVSKKERKQKIPILWIRKYEVVQKADSSLSTSPARRGNSFLK